MRFAVRYGARRVILYGWSTGASMALHAAVSSPLRERIGGLVLDSPVLDWQTTLRALAVARGSPPPCCRWRSAPPRAGPGWPPTRSWTRPCPTRCPLRR